MNELLGLASILALWYGLWLAVYLVGLTVAGLALVPWWGWLMVVLAGVCWTTGWPSLALTAVIGAVLSLAYRVGMIRGAILSSRQDQGRSDRTRSLAD